MKIEVDYDACESNALCEAFAPQNVRLDDDDRLEVLDEEVTDANRSAVMQAVHACPVLAITLVDS